MTILDHRHVARAEPTILKSRSCRLGLPPVLQKDPRAPDLEFAGFVRCVDSRSVGGQSLDLHAGQRVAHVPRDAISVQGIRQPHADLRHAVALQKCVVRDRPPADDRLKLERMEQ